jgi:gluconate 2-dehydrogenase gamma chain
MSAASLPNLRARTEALLASGRLTEPTRRALQARLDQRFGAPQAFTSSEMATLKAVCLRILPEPELVEETDLAAALEARWAAREPKGWRYADAPADLELIRVGLAALDEAAGQAFAKVDTDEQDGVLAAAARGEAPFDAAHRLDRWFEELMSAATEVFYAHPLVQVAIGYDGMADAPPLAVGLAAVAAEVGARGGRP